MRRFPDTLEYTGLNTPIGEEYEIVSLAVEGRIPAEVEGAFFRAVPDPAFPPFVEDGGASCRATAWSRAVPFESGQVDYDIRYVQPRATCAEVEGGARPVRQVPQSLHRRAGSAGVDRTVANTTPVWHAGRLLMTKEDGRPYASILTRSKRSAVRLRRQAEVRDDDGARAHRSGDRRDVLLRLRGRRSARRQGRLLHRRRAGNLVREQWFDVPYCSLMHDFVDHRELRAVPRLSDHLRSRAPEGRRRALGARAGPGELGRRHAALWRRLGHAVVQGPEGRVSAST